MKKPQISVLSILLRAKDMDLNCRNAFGITALMEAASRGHLNAVRMLTSSRELQVPISSGISVVCSGKLFLIAIET